MVGEQHLASAAHRGTFIPGDSIVGARSMRITSQRRARRVILADEFIPIIEEPRNPGTAATGLIKPTKRVVAQGRLECSAIAARRGRTGTALLHPRFDEPVFDVVEIDVRTIRRELAVLVIAARKSVA